jgi:stress-induced morphogen
MPIIADEIEQTLRSTIPITHLEIIDESSGCGESYSIFVVSEVCVYFENVE